MITGLTESKDTPMNRLLDQVEYKEVPRAENQENDLPYVTHEGKLTLFGKELTVYVLSNGQRIIPEESLINFFKDEE